MYSTETAFYHAILAGAAVLVILVTAFALTIVHYQRRKFALHKTRIRLEVNALEKERARIAGDLHDDLGASLSAIKLKLQCLTPVDEQETKIVYEAEDYIDEAMLKLRRISFNMMPRVLERKGLQQALKELIDMVEQTTTLHITLSYDCPVLNGEETIHIYRIAQEVLNNIVRHSQASLAAVELQTVRAMTILKITDNGVGFDKRTEMKTATGQGLQNILARADMLNAKMFLTTAPGCGVQYLFQIP